jgi:DNA-directed RNA polymerase subunit RPC12/RpoP
MPIRFRCAYCNRLLGIARRKAGTETVCPHCGYTIIVPEADEGTDGKSILDEAANMDEIESLLNPSLPAVAESPPPREERPRPAPAATPEQPTVPTPRPAAGAPQAAPPKSTPSGERPLFERDLDAVLGGSSKATARPTHAKPKPAPTSGMDSMSLGHEPGQIVLSSQKAAALAVGVIVLLALSFAAGFLIASR